ncbi:MAG TPA: nickel pincer cofactor biosynthesis protein LarC [Thermoanaerobaculaceae bacterium]|nr:nickel pincer cofactor biosynthesis protein LarC [Thermoanaerobaculaceae bacterium]
MPRVLHLDPFGGAAGDMLLGALLDLGVRLDDLQRLLAGLHLSGWRLEATRDRQQGFAGTRVKVHVSEESHPARHLHDIERLLTDAALPEPVRERSRTAFRRLFEAEAEVHGVALEKAHLHELAAVDAVIDIVGTCAAVHLLGVSAVSCGPVPVGSGTVATEHGLLPVPPPAVARLLRDVPLAGWAADGEMTTPTGATLVTTLADRFGPLPGGTVLGAGVGLGTRQFPELPNVLRAFLVDAGRPPAAGRPMVLVETTLDDVTGETVGALLDRLRAAGAVDAWCLTGTGRKGRPVVELRALAEPSRSGEVSAALFSEGATLGLRVVECTRPELERHVVPVATNLGELPVKVGVFDGRVVSVKPEHDACLAAALRAGLSLAAVTDAARAASPRIGDPWPPGTSPA